MKIEAFTKISTEKIDLNAEISDRFGLLPNFFCTAGSAPGLINELWGFAKSAYLDNPLPSLFKERLFVYLSRFCAVRYCIIRHVGFLIGHGYPAGDKSVTPETIDEVLRLLKRPAPDVTAMEPAYSRLLAISTPMPIPPSESQEESDLFDALAILFVEPRKAEKARSAIKHAIGESFFELTTAYLAFIRTAHYWTETHPELACEADMVQIMSEHPELGGVLMDTDEAERVQSGEMLRRALHQSEDKYRTLFNSIGEGFALCESVLNDAGQPADIRVLEANPTFEKIIGLNLRERNPLMLRHLFPSSDEKWIQVLLAASLSKKTVEFERQLTSQDRWFSCYSVPVAGNLENHHFVLLLTDITQRRRLERQKEDFLSIASHELKTPITSIKAYGQLLATELQEKGDTQNNLLAGKMNAQVNRLNDLISDLLDTTKITEGQLQLQYETFDFTELIRLVVEELQNLTNKQILEIGCQNSICLKGDKKRLEQVLTNLLGNAIKYSPEGGRITVSCQVERQHMKVSVVDNGIGIPTEAKEKIFDRFFRIKHDRLNTLPGLGLGLYICAGIVHRHGGDIGVENNPYGGSIFYFSLPLSEQVQPAFQ